MRHAFGTPPLWKTATRLNADSIDGSAGCGARLGPPRPREDTRVALPPPLELIWHTGEICHVRISGPLICERGDAVELDGRVRCDGEGAWEVGRWEVRGGRWVASW